MSVLRRMLPRPRAVGALALGTLAALALLEGALWAIGAVFQNRQETANLRPLAGGDTVIMCLGESQTALWGDDAYPRQLEEVLNQRGVGRFKVINLGRPAIDSHVILARLDADLARHRPNIVTVMMGINDGEKGFIDLEGYGDGSRPTSFWRRSKVYRLVRFLTHDVRREGVTARNEARLRETEARLRARIEQTHAPEAYRELIALYRRWGKLDQSKELRRELRARHPEAAAGDYEFGGYSEERLRRRVETAPQDHWAHELLARALVQQGRVDDAEAALKHQLAVNPDVESHLMLADFYVRTRRPEQAVKWFESSLQVRANDYAYVGLARLRARAGAREEAEQLLAKALAVAPSGLAYVELAALYRDAGRDADAERVLRQALALGPERWFSIHQVGQPRGERAEGPARAAVELALLYRRLGREREAREALQRAAINPMTFHNYQELREKVLAAGARLVAIQYPTRSAAPLHLMVPPGPGVVVVDNEESFRRAVERDGYAAYFVDAYGGDFGHCTRRGNRLVAESVGRAIVETFFAGSPR